MVFFESINLQNTLYRQISSSNGVFIFFFIFFDLIIIIVHVVFKILKKKSQHK